MFDLLNLIVAVVGGILAVLAWRKSRLADEANERYQEVQKQLAELQLIAAQKANIILQFQTETEIFYRTKGYVREPDSRRKRYLLIKNVGNVEAYNIKISFESASQQHEAPQDLNKIEPISILAPGTDLSINFSIMADEFNKFNGSWSWDNPNGKTETRKSYFVIPY